MIADLKPQVAASDILYGKHIQLEPIANRHRDEMRKAADYDHIWTYMPQKAMRNLFNRWFDDCLDKMTSGSQITYAVRRKSDQLLVGATAYYDIQIENKRLALGYSWYTPAVWGSVVNPEAKLLMLIQAFENWLISRIEMGTDSRNKRSYQAIKKLGATEEGLLREHMMLHDHVITDTIVFSILACEWPVIKMRLSQRVESC